MEPNRASRNSGQPAVSRAYHSLMAGLRFLTVLPVPAAKDDDGTYLAGSLFYFGVVGAIVGLIAGGAALLFATFTPNLVSAGLTVIVLSLVSGFLHMDGLADTADGFMSSRSAERCLEIMKDSRIGVMGCAAVCSVMLLKTAALASIPGQLMIVGLVIAATAGRVAIVCSMMALPYVRPGGGLGTLFYSGSEKKAAVVSVILLVAITLVFARWHMLITAFVFLLTLIVFSVICRRRIGGVTGDTFGAVCELTETAVLISFTT